MPGDALADLEAALEARFNRLLRRLERASPAYRVRFSRQLTASWGIIYFRRRLVRLSPYVFLLGERDLRGRSPAEELDLTLRHEAAHAYAYRTRRETGHTPTFQWALARLGVHPETPCDQGPTLTAYRWLYRCRGCGRSHPARRQRPGRSPCLHCGRSERLRLLRALPDPWARLEGREKAIRGATRRLERLPLPGDPARRLPAAPGASGLLADRFFYAPVSPKGFSTSSRRRSMKKLFGALPEELEPMNDLALDGARFRMSLETRRYGKAVTVLSVEGWETDHVTQLAHDLKSALGTGGTVKTATVELQGDHRRRVKTFLAEQGYKVEE